MPIVENFLVTVFFYASVAQLVEQGTENPRVVGSIPTGGICGFSSFGRARPCQGRGGGFEPRNPLVNFDLHVSCRFFCFFTANPRVATSIPTGGRSGFSSFGATFGSSRRLAKLSRARWGFAPSAYLACIVNTRQCTV